MWKRCWNVMVIRTGPWRYHQKRGKKRPERHSERKKTHIKCWHSVHTRSIRTASANFQETWCVYVPQPTNKTETEILVKPKDRIPMEQQSWYTNRNMTTVKRNTLGKRKESWWQDTKHTPQADTRELRSVNIWTIKDTCAAWKRPTYWTRKKGRPCVQEENQGGHDNPQEAWTEQDTGLDISAVILQLVSHDPYGSCDTNEGWEILPKIREHFHQNLTVCVARVIWKEIYSFISRK